jgi:hypothetical protein
MIEKFNRSVMYPAKCRPPVNVAVLPLRGTMPAPIHFTQAV